jgi:hypothetical protein
MEPVKITLEIPDALLRRAKTMAAARGISLGQFVSEATGEKLVSNAAPGKKPWLKLMGKLKHLHKETIRINRLIEEDSERIDAEMWH